MPSFPFCIKWTRSIFRGSSRKWQSPAWDDVWLILWFLCPNPSPTLLPSLPFLLIRQMVPGTEMSRHLCGRSLGRGIWRGGMSAIIVMISKILGQAPGKLNLEERQPSVLENSPQSAGLWAPGLLTQDFLWWCSALWWQTCRNYHVPLVAWLIPRSSVTCPEPELGS